MGEINKKNMKSLAMALGVVTSVTAY